MLVWKENNKMKYTTLIFDWGDTLSTLNKEDVPVTNDWIGQMLKDLYCRSYRLAILSNTHRYQDAQWIRRELAKADVLHYFECIVSSAIYGYHKPDKRIFEKIIDFMEIDPRKAVMVGDSEYCDGAAQLFGMSFLHVQKGEQWKSRLESLLDDPNHRRKLSRIVEYGLINETNLIVKMRHLSEPLMVGDTVLLDQDEYRITKSWQPDFSKEDCLKNQEKYASFDVKMVQESH